MSAVPEIAPGHQSDERELADAGALARLLHEVPMTVEEIVRLMRDRHYEVDDALVADLLRSQHIRPRRTPFTSAQLAQRAADREAS